MICCHASLQRENLTGRTRVLENVENFLSRANRLFQPGIDSVYGFQEIMLFDKRK